MHHRAANAVAGIHRHPDAARKVELGADLGDIGSGHVGACRAALAARQVAGFDGAADLLDGFAVNGGGPRDHLESVEFGRIVAARDHDGSIGLQMEYGVIEHRRGNHPEVRDLAAAGLEAAHEGVAQAGGTQARIAAEIDL